MLRNRLKMIRFIRKVARKIIIESEYCADKRAFTDITKDDILDVVFNGIIIEDYPKDKRGHSCSSKEGNLHQGS